MQIGVVGLGRMGANISRRLMKAGHSTVVWDANQAAVAGLGNEGATGATGLKDLADKLTGPPKAVWVMLPHGKITEDTIDTLATPSLMAAIASTKTTSAAAKHSLPGA